MKLKLLFFSLICVAIPAMTSLVAPSSPLSNISMKQIVTTGKQVFAYVSSPDRCYFVEMVD